MPALDAAVPGHERRDVPMHVREQLDLQVAADGSELHGEDGAPGHFALDLLEELDNFLVAVHLHRPEGELGAR